MAFRMGEVNFWKATIWCDKCKNNDFGIGNNEQEAQEALVHRGWTMNPKARKFIHLCPTCESRRRK